MSLTLEEVRNIANLARLRLTPEEIISYRTQLSEILEHFDRLNKLDTSGEPPDSIYFQLLNELRNDEPLRGIKLKDLMRNAAQVDDNQFGVPPVFD